MVKARVTLTKKNYVIKSSELKKILGIKNPEKITRFGCWVGMSPHDVEDDIDPDLSEAWYVETEVRVEPEDF